MNTLIALKKPSYGGQTWVQKETKSTQRHGASKAGVIRDTPQARTHTVQGEDQQDIGHHEEKQDLVQASSPSYRDRKGSNPDGESIRGRGGAYSFVACLSRMPIDHASLASRGRVVQHAAPLNPFATNTSNLVQTSCLAARASIESRYRRAPVSSTVKYPSSWKRRPPRRPILSRDGVFRPRWQ